MPLLLGIFFLLFSFLQQTIQWEVTSAAIAAETRIKEKRGKEDSNLTLPGDEGLSQTAFSEQKKGVPTEGRQEDIGKGESPYIPGLGALWEFLSAIQANWPLFLANLLLILIILLVERLYALRRSREHLDSLSGWFKALDNEIDRVKEGIQNVLFSIKNLASQVKAPLTAPQELRGPDLGNIASTVAKIASELERLPARVRDEIVQQLDLRERLQKEEQDKNMRETVQANLVARMKDLYRTFPILEICSATKHLLVSLQSETKDLEKLERNYTAYLNLAQQWKDIEGLQEKLMQNPETVNDELAKKLGGQLKEVQEASEALTKNHRNIWFTVLLDEAARFRSTKNQVERLMDLLSIEEITVQPGAEIKNREEIEISRVEGVGDRAFIREILEKGYLENKSGQVVKKPKVTVRFG